MTLPGVKPFNSRPLKIVLCAPDFYQMRRAIKKGSADATHIIQGYVAAGLLSHGHCLTYVVPRDFNQIVCTRDFEEPHDATLTWSGSKWFSLASKISWRTQQLLGVPYLNYFSNFRMFDACLQCLPDHDLVYERNMLYRSGVAMACKRLGLPYILYFEADDILEHDIIEQPIKGLLRWRAREAARYNLAIARCVICVSEAGKARLIQNWQVPEEKIVVFPNAVDVQRFKPHPEIRAEVRASLGIENNPLIIFVGSFYKWHDVPTLLKAFARVIDTHGDARLLLVGDGLQRKAMAGLAAELGISQFTTFTGMVPHREVPRLMAAADLAVVPYPKLDEEIWLSPLKLFEYMASGVAIIASKVGQLTDVIQDSINGLFVPAGDASALSSALEKLMDDQHLRRRLSQQAREDAVEKYSWDHYQRRLERVFSAVIAGEQVHKL
jgi:glycosyltransferase involved in cell wall biosynthesis